MGWNLVGLALAYVIGAPVLGLMGDWRLAFLAFVFPIALLSLFLALRELPSSSSRGQASGGIGNYLEGFREIFSNKSATVCLLGTILALASVQVLSIYAVAFYRQRFLVSTGFASIITTVAALFLLLGYLVGGRFMNRFGRKPLTFSAAFLHGIYVMTFMYVSDLWLSQALCYLGCLFVGIRATASISLTLEQVPRFRGTMMSVNQAAMSIGETIGTALGGAVLIWYGYGTTGFSMGAMGVVAALVFFFLVVDPTKRPIAV